MSVQKLTSDTADWAYEVKADFPYSQLDGLVPLQPEGRTALQVVATRTRPARRRVDQPVRRRATPCWPRAQLHHHVHAQRPHPPRRCPQMQAEGKNVALLPAVGSTDGVSIVSRSYWSFANDGLGDYDRSGYGGPTDTPYPDHRRPSPPTRPPVRSATRSTTAVPRASCPRSSGTTDQSGKPVITFENAPRPTDEQLARRPAEVPRADRVGVRHAGLGVPAVAGRGAGAVLPERRGQRARTPTCSPPRPRATRPTRAAAT